MNTNSMQYLIGKKIEMSQVFRPDGSVVPVTLVEATPCTVTSIREQDGKTMAVIATGSKKNAAKPQEKQFGDKGAFDLVKSFSLAAGEQAPEVGSVISVEAFQPGQLVSVIGTSKGRGFQGVVKRHGFAGHPSTHGHKDQERKSGSIGAGGVQRVFKGRRMAGRMGGEQVTIKNLEVVTVDAERNIIALKGAVPGARGSVLSIRSTNGDVWQK